MNKYLSSVPLLSKSEPGEELFLYLTVSLVIINVIFVREEGKVQKPVYYINKVLHDAKTRYIRLEKFIFTLITLAKKLLL